jgi:DNA modification methylase
MLELNKIYNMDCIEGMKLIDDNSIDSVITDPPYGINKQKGIIGDENLELFYKASEQIYRILKPNTWFITFCDKERLPLMFNINNFEYSWCGIIYYRNRQRLKRCPMGLNKSELYLVFKKGKPKYNYMLWDVQEFVYCNKPEHKPNKYHRALKPINCIRKLVSFASKVNGVVLDPFMGSGTTALACKSLNRNFIGFEIDENYYNISLQRLLNIPKRLDNWIEKC